MLEKDQEERMSQLAQLTGVIKESVNEIAIEIAKSKTTVEEIDTGMGNASDLLQGNIQRIKNLMNSGSSNHFYLLIFFVVLVFLIIYWVFVRR